MLRAVLVVLALALINVPAAYDGVRTHEIDSKGVVVAATVVKSGDTSGRHYVSYKLPVSVDKAQRTFTALVTNAAFDQASHGTIDVRYVPAHPALFNEPVGQVRNNTFLSVAIFGDLLMAAYLLVTWRLRRRWKRKVVTSIDGDLVTFSMGRLSLTARNLGPALAEVGAAIDAPLSFVPDSDVDEGGALTQMTQIEGALYRLNARVLKGDARMTTLFLPRGLPLEIVSDDIGHNVLKRRMATVTGEFLLGG